MAEESWEIGSQMTWADFKKLAEHVEPWKVPDDKPVEVTEQPEAGEIQHFWDIGLDEYIAHVR